MWKLLQVDPSRLRTRMKWMSQKKLRTYWKVSSKDYKTELVSQPVFITQHTTTQTLQDTIVRWSAAKGVARIASRLPSSFADQVLDTIIGLFSIHSLAAANIYDLPAIAESTWHGACLSSAEMARRGLVSGDKLVDVMDWLSKVHIAIFYDHQTYRWFG